jgi:hypothetical protein
MLNYFCEGPWSVLENEQTSEKAIAASMHTILICNEQKRQIIMDLIEIQHGIEQRQNQRKSLPSLIAEQDRQRIEAYESQRRREQAVF